MYQSSWPSVETDGVSSYAVSSPEIVQLTQNGAHAIARGDTGMRAIARGDTDEPAPFWLALMGAVALSLPLWAAILFFILL